MRSRKPSAVAALGALTVSTLVGATATAAGASTKVAQDSSSSISVLYTNNYVFDSDALAAKWWSSIAKQWAKADPSVKLTLLGTGGTDVDEMNKAAVLFRSSSETPCVIQLPTTYVGEFAGSGYLASLNSLVSGSSAPAFWTGMPKAVQQISTIGGTVYAVNAGNNDSGILYNKVMLKKAGVMLPWVPKTWQDLITTAEKVHKSDPGVYDLWAAAGIAAGPTNVLQGIGNLIDGSTNPTMIDPKTGKWVVDSPGLKATFEFYQELYADGLGAPASQLFPSDSVGQPPLLMKQGKLAIAIGSNWYTGDWLPGSGAPWPQAGADIGIAPIPTEFGQAPGNATTIGGWAWAISAACKNKAAAWKFITLGQAPTNQLETAVWSGFVPPDTSVGTQPAFVKSSLYQEQFSQYATNSVALPNNTNFPVFARALNTVTGDFVQNPKLSISSALSTMSQLVTEQLGSNSVETIK